MAGVIIAHTSRDFELELRELRAHLLAMGARCERAVQLAFDAFCQGAPEPIRAVEALDAQIDRDELEIHSLALRIFALRQPVADDLRFLATALRLVVDLQRIGAEARNIAERTDWRSGHPNRLAGGELVTLANEALAMLHQGLRAFVQSDGALAGQVLACDDDVDEHCATVISSLTAHISNHRHDVRSGLCAIRVAKCLERIADHATNVAEEVIFMVRADDVRHGHWRSLPAAKTN